MSQLTNPGSQFKDVKLRLPKPLCEFLNDVSEHSGYSVDVVLGVLLSAATLNAQEFGILPADSPQPTPDEPPKRKARESSRRPKPAGRKPAK